MSSGRLAKISLTSAIAMLVISVIGFITALVLNAFFLDDYDAYGEVPVPGSATLHLPAGEVTVSLHTVVLGNLNGGLPVPPLGVTIVPPDGVAQPVVTENIGSTTTVNNDAHVRVWVAQIAAEGDYNVTTDGQVNGYVTPRLAFGHGSAYGFMVWVFVGLFVFGLVDVVLSIWWLRRTRRKAASAIVAEPNFPTFSRTTFPGPATFPATPAAPTFPPAPAIPTPRAHEPSDEGVRLERLKTLAALRDSGALSHEEFEMEKRRILEGH
jgi:Short C-terminal domain